MICIIKRWLKGRTNLLCVYVTGLIFQHIWNVDWHVIPDYGAIGLLNSHKK